MFRLDPFCFGMAFLVVVLISVITVLVRDYIRQTRTRNFAKDPERSAAAVSSFAAPVQEEKKEVPSIDPKRAAMKERVAELKTSNFERILPALIWFRKNFQGMSSIST